MKASHHTGTVASPTLSQSSAFILLDVRVLLAPGLRFGPELDDSPGAEFLAEPAQVIVQGLVGLEGQVPVVVQLSATTQDLVDSSFFVRCAHVFSSSAVFAECEASIKESVDYRTTPRGLLVCRRAQSEASVC